MPQPPLADADIDGAGRQHCRENEPGQGIDEVVVRQVDHRQTADGKTARIAGGIGVTPFISILRQAARLGQERQFVLVYSNRRPEDAAYLDEIMAFATHFPNLRLIPTLTQADAVSPAWAGRTGRIDSVLLASIGANNPVYYVAGPPSFVEGMLTELSSHGADEDDIRNEGFYGY